MAGKVLVLNYWLRRDDPLVAESTRSLFSAANTNSELRVNVAQFLQYTAMFLSQSVDAEHM